MGSLMVITTTDLAHGFQLAGVETFGVNSVEEAEQILVRFLRAGEANLIAVRQDLLDHMSFLTLRRVERSYSPVVISIPGGTPTRTAGERRRHIAELIRRAIGFQITFDAERADKE